MNIYLHRYFETREEKAFCLFFSEDGEIAFDSLDALQFFVE